MGWSMKHIALQAILVISLLVLKTEAVLTCTDATSVVCVSCTSYGTCGTAENTFPVAADILPCDPGLFCDPDEVTAAAPCVETPPTICDCSTAPAAECIADPINTQNIKDADAANWAAPAVPATTNEYLDCHSDYQGTPVTCPKGTQFPPLSGSVTTPTPSKFCKCDGDATTGFTTEVLLCDGEDGTKACDSYISKSNDACEVYFYCAAVEPAGGISTVSSTDPMQYYLTATSCATNQCFDADTCECGDPPTAAPGSECSECGAYIVTADPIVYQNCLDVGGGVIIDNGGPITCSQAYIETECSCGCEDVTKCIKLENTATPDDLTDYYYCNTTTGALRNTILECQNGKEFDQDACDCVMPITTTTLAPTICPDCGTEADLNDPTMYYVCELDPPIHGSCSNGGFFVDDICDCFICPSCNYATTGGASNEFYYCANQTLVKHTCPNKAYVFDTTECACQQGPTATVSPPAATTSCPYTQNPALPNCWLLNGEPAGCCPTDEEFNAEVTVCRCEAKTTTVKTTTDTTTETTTDTTTETTTDTTTETTTDTTTETTTDTTTETTTDTTTKTTTDTTTGTTTTTEPPTNAPGCPDCSFKDNVETSRKDDFIYCANGNDILYYCDAGDVFYSAGCGCLPPAFI